MIPSSELIEELKRIQSVQGDVQCEVVLRTSNGRVAGNVINVVYRSNGTRQPYIEITAEEK